MNCVKRKLKSTGGASIIIALLFFLICCTVGVSVLAAAKANASRLVSQRESEEAYLTVRSAAQLMREELETLQLKSFAECEKYYSSGLYVWNQIDREDSVNGRIEDIFFSFLEKGTDTEDCTFVFQAEGMEDVSARVFLKMGEKKSGEDGKEIYECTLEGFFSYRKDTNDASKPYDYQMTLLESGTVIGSKIRDITESYTNENGEPKTRIIGEEWSYTISFSNGKLEATN